MKHATPLHIIAIVSIYYNFFFEQNKKKPLHAKAHAHTHTITSVFVDVFAYSFPFSALVSFPSLWSDLT